MVSDTTAPRVNELVERLRAAVTYAYMPMAVRKLLSEAAEALSLPTPTVDREAIARAVYSFDPARFYDCVDGWCLMPWEQALTDHPIYTEKARKIANQVAALLHPIKNTEGDGK